MRDVVTNSSPLLSPSARADRHSAPLPRLYERGLVPPAELAELAEGARWGYNVPVPATLPWVEIEAPPGAALLRLVTDLGDGEREPDSARGFPKKRSLDPGYVPALTPLWTNSVGLASTRPGNRATVIKLADE